MLVNMKLWHPVLDLPIVRRKLYLTIPNGTTWTTTLSQCMDAWFQGEFDSTKFDNDTLEEIKQEYGSGPVV